MLLLACGPSSQNLPPPSVVAGAAAEGVARGRADAQDWASLRRRYVDASMADGKGGSDSTAVRHWIRFCVYAREISPERRADGVNSERRLLEEQALLMDFVIWLVTCRPLGGTISPDSAAGYVGRVRAWHLRTFHRSICGDLEVDGVRDALKGLRRSVPVKPRRKRFGCRTQDLASAINRFLSLLPGDSAHDRLDKLNWRAALAVAFCAMMRAGEFALGPKETWDAAIHLARADVDFFYDEDGVLCVAIMMRPLKTGKPQRGKTCRVVLRSGGSLLDPVRLLDELLRLDPTPEGAGADTPLFRSRSRGAPRCISVREVRDMVRLLMRAIGCDPKLFGAHSLRIGGASAALAANIHPATIRVMGRWASDIYEIYTRLSFQASIVATQLIGSTPFHDIERAFHSEELELLPSELLAAPVFDDDELSDWDEEPA